MYYKTFQSNHNCITIMIKYNYLLSYIPKIISLSLNMFKFLSSLKVMIVLFEPLEPLGSRDLPNQPM